MHNNVITVENLSKRYLLGHREQQHVTFRDMLTREAKNFARKSLDLAHGREIVQGDEIEEFWALQDVSFDVQKGEVLGIIGRNGAGKSTLLKVIAGIYIPGQGEVTVEGKIASLIGGSLGIDPELTGRENIELRGLFLGLSKAEIRRRLEDIIDFTELGSFIDLPFRTYSAGMRARLDFAISTSIQAEILLLDEGLGVGDASFVDKASKRMDSLARAAGIVVVASHSEELLRQTCSEAALMDAGQILAIGTIDEVFTRYNSSRAA